ncbi:MAG: hypothetical protein WCC49_15230 [Pantoea agglomerans]
MLNEKITVLTCSLKNIPPEDACILEKISHSFDDEPEWRWAIQTFFSFIILPDILSMPAEVMTESGLSRCSISLFTELCHSRGAEAVILDRDAAINSDLKFTTGDGILGQCRP